MALKFRGSILLSFITLALTLPDPAFASIDTGSNKILSLGSKADKGGGGGGSVAQIELWCVAKNNAENQALQSALDWACGPGGTDCSPIQQGGPCYDPRSIQSTASYVFNDYFIKHGTTQDSCNFAGTAALTSLNPSRGSCKFPSSLTVKNGSLTALPSGSIVGIGSAGADTSAGLQIPKGGRCGISNTVSLLLSIALVFQ